MFGGTMERKRIALTRRHLERANIPERYWTDVRLGNVPDSAPYKEDVLWYLRNLESNIARGDGLLLYSQANGTGKTGLATIVLRMALMLGFTGFYIRAAALQTAEVTDRMFDEFELVSDRVRNVDVLVLDDLGKEHKAKSGFTENLVEDVIRERVQRAKATIITTNLLPGQLETEYSKDFRDVLREAFHPIHVVDGANGGVDWRQKKKSELKWRLRKTS